MKKLLLSIFIILFLALNLFGQVQNFNEIPKDILAQLDKMGVENSPLMNCSEGTYFNVIFEKTRNDFDFTNKKIGFITGSNGKTKSSKMEYFKLENDRFYSNRTTNGGTLFVFNASQKAESGGYDAVIVFWSKVLVPANQAIKLLKGGNR